MNELLVPRVSPNNFVMKSRGSKSRGSRGRRSKNRFNIELGKTVTESPTIKDKISLNNFNLKNADIATKSSNNTSSNRQMILSNSKKKMKQQLIDKYIKSGNVKQLKPKNNESISKKQKYYKSPINKKPHTNITINMPSKVENTKNNTYDNFRKISVRVNKTYYQNIDSNLFNPNTILVEQNKFQNMNSEDIYLCNLISQNIIFKS